MIQLYAVVAERHTR